MNRRQFLSSTAAVTAALSAPSPLRAAESPRRIPIGFLGATYSHGPDKIKLAMTSPDWEFVDDFKELAAAVRWEKALTASLDEEWLVAGTVLQLSDML